LIETKRKEGLPLELYFFLVVSEDFGSETQRVSSFYVEVENKEENEYNSYKTTHIGEINV
jgi:hypothetical protein